MAVYYDIRFLLLPLVPRLQAYLDADKTMSISTMVSIAIMLAVSVFTTIRVQLFGRNRVHNGLRFVRCHGEAAISVPFIFSLLITLLLPSSSFWTAYLGTILMSFWSDSVHGFVTRYSFQQERQLLLPVVVASTAVQPQPGSDEEMV